MIRNDFPAAAFASVRDRVASFFAFVLILCLIPGNLQAGAPEIGVEQAAVAVPDGGAKSLGSVAMGANSPAMEFTILNTGDEILTGVSVAKDGDNPGDFIISAPAASVAGGGNTTFTVTFTPTGEGLRSCALHISSDDADENPYDITLSGTGTPTAPLMIAQSAYLKSSNTFAEDYFGYSVAVSGETVVVGVPNAGANNTGSVHVFTRAVGVWTHQALLTAGNPGFDDLFGYSVGLSGDTLIVGALSEDSGTAGVNGIPNENSTDSGAAYVFTRTVGVWTQQAFLKPGNPGAADRFGAAVAVAGDTVVVGAYGEDSNTTGVNSIPNELASGSGAAYVFSRTGSAWTQQAYLKADNTGAGDQFGSAVAVAADTIVVGAYDEDSSTTGVGSVSDELAAGSGAAYVFTRTGTNWTQQAYLKAGNTGAGDEFGKAVAVSGDSVIVGAPTEDSGTAGVNPVPNESANYAGAAYVFSRSGIVWTQQAFLKAGNPGVNDGFGEAVAISGDLVIVGSTGESGSSTVVNGPTNEGALYAGAAYIFRRDSTGWAQLAYLKAANSQSLDFFGLAVAISGNTVVASAPSEGSGSSGVNSTPNENAIWAGAAYTFDISANPDIAIRSPGGLALSSGAPADNLGFGTAGSVVPGNPATFTLHNYGSAELLLQDLSLTGANPDDFVLDLIGTDQVAPGDSRQFTIAFRPAAQGPRVASLSITSTDPDESPFTISLAGTGVTAAELWRYQYFLTTADSGDAADVADPDLDGVSNLLERAFNLHPKQSANPVLIADSGDTGLPLVRFIDDPGGPFFSIQYLRRKATTNPGLIYTPQVSSELLSWQDLAGPEILQSIGAEWERVTVQEPATGQPIRFGRVQVVSP